MVAGELRLIHRLDQKWDRGRICGLKIIPTPVVGLVSYRVSVAEDQGWRKAAEFLRS